MNERTVVQQQKIATLTFKPLRRGFLQRKCACGQHTTNQHGECTECHKKRLGLQRRACNASGPQTAPPIVLEVLRAPGRPLDPATRAFMEPRFGHDFSNVRVHSTFPGMLQAKLTINQPGDIYEQEADRVAEQVMRMPVPTLRTPCAAGGAPYPKCRDGQANTLHQKAAFPSALESAEVPNTFLDSLGPGRPLDAATRAFFEPRFGADFGHVRVHTDSMAAESARAVNALAYTLGRNMVFGAGQYAPGTSGGQRLLAHELVHVVQQGGAVPRTTQSEGSRSSTTFQRISEQAGSQVSDVIQRAGDPAAIPPVFPCPTDLTAGRPAGTDLTFGPDKSAITPAHTALLTTFRATWLAAGGTDDILVHGYASTDGDQGHNWTLSCNRAQAVQAKLQRLGIPAVRTDIVAHGESTDFGPGAAANRHAVVSTSPAGIVPLPLTFGVLTPRDNFAGRSVTRFGVGEVIALSFFSIPPRPAADFGGLQWFLVSGGGTLVPGLVSNDGTATYTAPATASAVRLELRVATGATAGRVISTHTITIVIPSGVRMTAVAGTAPSFSFTGPIPAGTWGAGFQANVFVDPRDVSFQGVVFGEGTVASVVTPPGGFQGSFVHPVNTFGPGHFGNATTGTPVSPPVDNIISERKGPTGTFLGLPTCGASDFLWAIPWEFSVAGGPRTPFAGGFTANHHVTSTFFCNATIEKAGAGPFCRRIDGTTC